MSTTTAVTAVGKMGYLINPMPDLCLPYSELSQ
jgi:hypothetical protein